MTPPASETPAATPKVIDADRQRRVAGALKRYSVMAYTTGVFLLLLCLDMILKYLLFPAMDIDSPSWLFTLVASIHGWIFIIYCLASLDLGVKARWAPGKWVTTILAGVVPVLSFVLERRRRNEVIEAFGL